MAPGVDLPSDQNGKNWSDFRSLASDYKRAGDFEMAIVCLKRALELIPENRFREIAMMKSSLASHYCNWKKDYVTAERLARESLAIELANPTKSGPQQYILGWYHILVADILKRQGRWNEAAAHAEEGLKVYSRVLGETHPATLEKAKYRDFLKENRWRSDK